eukprot:1154080-Pelagomonas_calceolata.AAC.1
MQHTCKHPTTCPVLWPEGPRLKGMHPCYDWNLPCKMVAFFGIDFPAPFGQTFGCASLCCSPGAT